MFSTMFVVVPADETGLVAKVLGGLDPNEHATVTFRTSDEHSCGVYVVEFLTEQKFDEHTNNKWELDLMLRLTNATPKPDVTNVMRARACEIALRSCFNAMLDNDNSPDKSHPWIPGADCKSLKSLVESALTL